MKNKRISPVQNAIKQVLSEAEEEEIGALVNTVFAIPDVTPMSMRDFQRDMQALLKKGLIRAEIRVGLGGRCVANLSPEQAIEKIKLLRFLKMSRSGGWILDDPDLLEGHELVIIDDGLKDLP